jgi:hypothetical protein
MSGTQDLARRVADARALLDAVDNLPAMEAELRERQAEEAEERAEAERREAERQAGIIADIDAAVAGLKRIDGAAAILAEALALGGEAIDRLRPIAGGEWAVLQNIRGQVIPRVRHTISSSGFNFGAMAFPDGKTLSDMMPRAWLLQLAGIKDNEAA